MDNKIVTFRADINKITTMETWTRIILDAQELPPEEMATLFALKSEGAKVAIQKEDFKSGFKFEDMPDVPEVKTDSKKSPSQHQRGLIHVLWLKSGMPEGSSDMFYLSEMNRIAEYIKAKISKYE
jgi:ribonuclease I